MIHFDSRRCRTACVSACLALASGRFAAAQQPPAPQQRAAQQGNAAPIDYTTAREARRLVAVRAAGTIQLDGILDEVAWQTAPVARDFIQNDPREGSPATYDTEVRIVYDDDALYFGVFAKDDEPGRMIVNDLKKDFTTDGSDGFRIILDTFRDERNGYQFATNPAGAKWDAQMANEGRENNVNWDGIWDVATSVSETGWNAEIRIPFRTLKFSDAEQQVWGLNFERKVRRLNEDSYWAPIPRIYDIQRVSLAGTVEGLRGLQPGKNLRFKPYALTSSNTAGGGGARGDFDAGIDVKYGVTSGLTWDFTVNTDFSQVEADEQQINLSRFSLFFPEKRDFFLENSGIFVFGGGGGGVSAVAGVSAAGGGGGGGGGGRQNAAQEMRLFFSRRIGLSDSGVAIPILAGTRLTGREGRFSMGLLNIQQRDQATVPSTNFTAIRVRRDIFANSDIGAMVLNKEEEGSHYNRTAGLDANLRFGFFTGNVYAAQTFSPEGVTAEAGSEYATRASARWEDRVWQIAGRYDTIGPDFNDEMGFVPRTNVNSTFAYVGRRFRPQSMSKWLREMRPHWQIDSYARQEGDGLDSRYMDFHFFNNFQDGSSMEVGANSNVEVVRAPFTINSGRGRIEPGRYEFYEYFAFWNTNAAARFSVNSRFSTGDFYDGHRNAYTFGPSVRLNENLNASVNLQVNDIELSSGSFVSTLVTGRVNYSFNTKMFLNALLQYNSDTRQVSSNIRFNIIHRPLSDFFLVYNERRDERVGDLLDRAIVAKMTYLIAF
jgi:hypothetical protein